jgi:hypothetical protein
MVPALLHPGALAASGIRHGERDVMHFTGNLRMPEIPQIPLDLALIAGRAIFLVFCFVIASITFTRWRGAAARSEAAAAEQSAALLASLASLAESVAATHRRLDEMAERFEGEGRRVAAAGATAPSYQIAIRLARGGAPREELMASCGLTRQEAELVQRLHAPARQPKLAVAG